MFFLAALPFMYCDAPSAVVSIRKAVDATHAGAGHVTLADGASFEVTTPDDDSFVVRLRKADRVQLCYAPPQAFADAGPTARMAIAGNVRTSDSMYALAYPAKRAAAARAPSTGRLPPAFGHAVATLAGIDFPVLVPSTFNGMAIGKDMFVVATHGSDRYRVLFNYAPDCTTGAFVCSEGSFSGYGRKAIVDGRVTNPPDGPLSIPPSEPGAHAVRLMNGSTAYYFEAISGAGDGGSSSLRWSQGGVTYAIESRISTEKNLVSTANSAIANGRLSR